MNQAIEQLLREPESKTLEFKRDLSSPKPLLKTLVAFANTAGGKLIIGVEDDKTVIGIAQPLDEEERLANMIADAIAPRLVPTIEMVTAQGKTLLLVEVFLSGSRPHWLKVAGAENGVYVRLGSSNRQADGQLIAELQRGVAGVSFDTLPMPDLNMEALDLAAMEADFSSRTVDPAMLQSLKILVKDQGRLVPSQGGMLLYGKDRRFYFDDAWIQCGRFIGNDKGDIFDHIDLHDPLPRAVDSIMLFLKKHAMRGADFSEIRRKDLWSIPLNILREIIINALVHADYSHRGSPIRVAFFDNRIEVESPGLLLPGLTVEDMKQGISQIRNPVTAHVFRELDLIERGAAVYRAYSERPRPLIYRSRPLKSWVCEYALPSICMSRWSPPPGNRENRQQAYRGAIKRNKKRG
nr:helix-turn-helix domain-containing protein [Desulfogranum mediterraneum]